MKAFFASLLILSVVALAGSPTSSPLSGVQLTPDEMSAALGTGFWGGLICGVAAGGVVAGVTAATTVTTAGAGAVWGIAVGTSLAIHVFGACMLLE